MYRQTAQPSGRQPDTGLLPQGPLELRQHGRTERKRRAAQPVPFAFARRWHAGLELHLPEVVAWLDRSCRELDVRIRSQFDTCHTRGFDDTLLHRTSKHAIQGSR